MKKFFSLLLALTALTTMALEGSWKGELNIGPQKLNVVFNFGVDEAGNPVATMDSPDQGVKGIPCQVLCMQQDSVSLSIPKIGLNFSGRIATDSIEGKICQGPYTFPVVLTPGEVTFNRPQTPRPPFPYTQCEVTFENPDDGTQLSGTLVLPEGEPTAWLVMVTGSGQQNRDEEIFGHKPFAVIADFLARNGVATLRYDDRGMGSSQGDPQAVTLDSNTADALAAVNFLRTQAGEGKVGILGHSEGGLITYRLGAAGKVDFAVSLAGPALSGVETLVIQNAAILPSLGFSQQQADDYATVLREVLKSTLKGEKPDVSATADALKITLLPGLAENMEGVRDNVQGWLKSFLLYDPAEDIRNCNIPVILLLGGNDLQVLAEPNSKAFFHYCTNCTNKQSKILPGLNHLFQPCQTGMPDEYKAIETTFAPEALQAILDFVRSL